MPGGDVPSARGATRPSRGAVPFSERPMPSAAENVDASMRAVPFSERPVPSALLDSSFLRTACALGCGRYALGCVGCARGGARCVGACGGCALP